MAERLTGPGRRSYLTAVHPAERPADVASLEELLARLREGRRAPRLDLAGLPAGARALVAARLAEAAGPALVVTESEEAADAFARELGFFLAATEDSPSVLRIPDDELLPYDEISPDPSAVLQRLAGLATLALDGAPQVVVVSARMLARRVLPRALLRRAVFTLRPGETVDRDALARRLVEAGYRNVPLVEDPGTFSLRGGLLDVYSPLHPLPVRVDLFGDEIESLCTFDPVTQRRREEVARLRLCPAREAPQTPEAIRRAGLAVRDLAAEVGRPTRSLHGLLEGIEAGHGGLGIESLLPGYVEGGLVPLWEHLEGLSLVFVDDPAAVEAALSELWSALLGEYEAARAAGRIAFPPAAHYLRPEETLTRGDGRLWVYRHVLLVSERPQRPVDLGWPAAALRGPGPGADAGEGTLAPFVEAASTWKERGQRVVVACSGPGRRDTLRRLLEARGLLVRSFDGPLPWPLSGLAALGPADVYLGLGEVGEGFVAPEFGLALVSEAEIFGSPRRAVPRRARPRAGATAFAEGFQALSEGDYVVHVEHGIARYRGLTRLEIRGVAGEFLLLEFAGGDKLYLPLYRLGQVQKYAGAEGEVRLDRLGGETFALRKKKVKEDLLRMAGELLQIYAARKAHPGTAFSAPDEDFERFVGEFPHEETPDQRRAAEEVIADMMRPEPMDRLLVGDVGFGKTEVALRAAMKAILDGKQVAVLVPTTVLAAQHELTFRERFAGWPVVVEAVSRFRRPKEVKEVLARTARGAVDVLIGTHRLLSRDVDFRDLGLVIIDEEQRFGVRQKEALKKLRRQVDVLALSATPIPRTLHMSLSGIRDLSIIATPPRDRRAIRTFVARYEAHTVREAVEQELSRGGQVYFVHDRVQSIGAVHEELRQMLPAVRIEVAHGQMNERALERAMTRFVRREADLLLCTSIIESGLDIPSVNTILIYRADRFGLAQLYQLRGRVGRSSERAYAYLLVSGTEPLSKDARKRLAALQELSELGSGFRLASYDMEIRGAGNLLGPDQSGHIAAVGFDLYARLLDEAVRELRGEPPSVEVEPEVELPVAAYLDEDYVPDVQQRLLLYKRLAGAANREALQELREELVDRFGPLPEEAENLLALMEIRLALKALRVRSLESGPGRLVLSLGRASRLSGERLMERVLKSQEGDALRMRLGPGMKLLVSIAPDAEGAEVLRAAGELLQELAGCVLSGGPEWDGAG
ncbi:MAG: transcription-repair coupling factor [Deltaproteobacteria bacterium]|nr:MAG: transcription-repair coupling factor [Deltaproteobacteria bacterium]